MMPRSVVGLPSTPRPPGKNHSNSSANHRSLHVLNAPPSRTQNDNQRHRSIHSIPPKPRSSLAPHQGEPSAHRLTASERLRISSQLGHRHEMSFSSNSTVFERRETTQANTSPPQPSETPGSYWNRAGEITSAAVAQWKVGIPALGNLSDDFEEEDGHLLKVMRAYHLNKARRREDLPDWLFNEKERGEIVPLRNRIPERLTLPPREDKLVPPIQSFHSVGSESPGRWKKLLSLRWNPNETRRAAKSVYETL